MDSPVIPSTTPERPPPQPTPVSSSPNPPNGSIILLNLPISTKLNRTNYLAWKSQIEPLLHGYGLHQFLSPPAPDPTVTIDGQVLDNPAHRQDQMLLGWLRSSLSDTLLGQVVSCRSSSALWLHLQHTFSATSRARLAELTAIFKPLSKAALPAVTILPASNQSPMSLHSSAAPSLTTTLCSIYSAVSVLILTPS